MAFGYDTDKAIWPDFAARGVAAPVRVGMDRRTGKMLVGWEHVAQSLERLFTTRFHERVLRRWVGSFVPHILGEVANQRNILRFFGAIATAIDLWEPCYRVQRVYVVNRDGTPLDRTTAGERLRSGAVAFQVEGVYLPRGHLGDNTPESRLTLIVADAGGGQWEARRP